MTKRPISVSHLVFGLIFLGAAVLWAVGAATGADAPDVAAVAPAVLIGAGVAGLIAIVVNARNARIDAEKALGPSSHTGYADTGVHDDQEQS
jgi:hypothetical protein